MLFCSSGASWTPVRELGSTAIPKRLYCATEVAIARFAQCQQQGKVFTSSNSKCGAMLPTLGARTSNSFCQALCSLRYRAISTTGVPSSVCLSLSFNSSSFVASNSPLALPDSSCETLGPQVATKKNQANQNWNCQAGHASLH